MSIATKRDMILYNSFMALCRGIEASEDEAIMVCLMFLKIEIDRHPETNLLEQYIKHLTAYAIYEHEERSQNESPQA